MAAMAWSLPVYPGAPSSRFPAAENQIKQKPGASRERESQRALAVELRPRLYGPNAV